MSEPVAVVGESIEALTRTGTALFETWMRSMRDLTAAGLRMYPLPGAGELPKPRRTCEIPPACWLPHSLGEIRSFVCPGGKAVVHVRVTNCQPQASRIQAAVTPSEFSADVDPDTLTLGAMQRGRLTASVSVPTDACPGRPVEVLLWVVGCNAHYLRWTIEPADGMSSSCHEIEVEDCPDPVHHWYDHFYCHRACFAQGKISRPGASLLVVSTAQEAKTPDRS